MRFLVTSSRMPFALDEIRKLGQEGHAVIASDTFRAAPGSHSRFVEKYRLTASPRYETLQFIADITAIIEQERIDFVLPGFEEALYLAHHIDQLPTSAAFFIPPFATLARLHSKAHTLALAKELSVRTPETLTVTTAPELKKATHAFERYFARAVYSRGGVSLLTNTGPLAGTLRLADCHPTSENPWLVQEYVEGPDVCCFSIAHHGRIAAHATYVHPREIEHAGGIVFESIVDPDTLDVAQRFVRHTGYHGQVSFDFKRTRDGLVLIECNPRPTAGVYVMEGRTFVSALLEDAPRETVVVEAGIRRKISSALIRDMVLHWKEAPADLEALLSDAGDVYAVPGDVVPALYQLLSYAHVIGFKLNSGEAAHNARDLMAAYFYDICWNGNTMA